VRQVLDRHGILFLDDEVICGYGRTGELFAAGSMGLRPDMMSLAKGMTSGYFPVSATVISGELTTGSSRAAPGTAPSLTPRPARAIRPPHVRGIPAHRLRGPGWPEQVVA